MLEEAHYSDADRDCVVVCVDKDSLTLYILAIAAGKQIEPAGCTGESGDMKSPAAYAHVDILLIEDDPSIRVMYKLQLEHGGHRVRLVADAQAAFLDVVHC